MKQGCLKDVEAFLYEPRMMLRTLVTSTLESENHRVQSHQILPTLIQSIGETKAENKVLLLGVGGAGHSIYELLRFIRRVKTLKVKTVVWVPADFPWIRRLLSSLYVQYVVCENDLETTLLPALTQAIATPVLSGRKHLSDRHTRGITQTELDILLQFASGLNSKEMATRRECSYKTIFSWKHNLSEALELESHSQWLELLTEVTQLSSLYQQG